MRTARRDLCGSLVFAGVVGTLAAGLVWAFFQGFSGY